MFGDSGIQVAQKMGKTRLRCRVFMMASETLLFDLISKIPVHKMASMCTLESYLTLFCILCTGAFDDLEDCHGHCERKCEGNHESRITAKFENLL